jgi:hypothetical protein
VPFDCGYAALRSLWERKPFSAVPILRVSSHVKSFSAFALVNKNAKNLKRDICVNPGEHVIQDNTEPASDLFQLTAREWFNDIQKPKEEKSDGDEKEGLGDPEHGEKISHDLINDDPLIIFFLPMVLGFFCNPTREKEEGENR